MAGGNFDVACMRSHGRGHAGGCRPSVCWWLLHSMCRPRRRPPVPAGLIILSDRGLAHRSFKASGTLRTTTLSTAAAGTTATATAACQRASWPSTRGLGRASLHGNRPSRPSSARGSSTASAWLPSPPPTCKFWIASLMLSGGGGREMLL